MVIAVVVLLVVFKGQQVNSIVNLSPNFITLGVVGGVVFTIDEMDFAVNREPYL